MAIDNESFNRDLYDLLKVRGYKPVPLDSKNQRVPASQTADVIQFTFIKDGEDFGKAWVTIDDAQNVIVYYDDEQQNSPSSPTPGVEYDDSWTGLLKHLKNWAQRRQLSFELSNKDRLGDDMKQREYYKMKEKLGESKSVNEVSTDTEDSYYMKAVPQKTAAALTRQSPRFKDLPKDIQDRVNQTFDKRKRGTDRFVKKHYDELTKSTDQQRSALQVKESWNPMGKTASYNDAVPSVKIIVKHNRSLEEGEARYRNVARIFLENQDGERFLAPTTRPGIARVYARHIAEGGLPNDERWNHIKTVCEDYNKMAGFVRATKNKEFNESALSLVNEGINHYNSLRETLHKLTTHRGYNTYFESWTPTLMEDEGSEDISEMFMYSSMDPRIESAMPILSRLKKPVNEMAEVDNLAEWAEDIISEKLELDEMDKEHGSKRDFDNPRGPDKTAKPVSVKQFAKGALKSLKRGMAGWEKGMHDVDTVKAATKTLSPDQKEKALSAKAGKGSPAELQQKLIKRKKNKEVDENFIGMAPQAVAEEQLDEVGDTDAGQKALVKTYKKAGSKAYRAGHAKDEYEHGYTSDELAKHKARHKETMKQAQSRIKPETDYWAEEIEEDLGVGQLGPTEKVRNNNIGKLVGASESTEHDELKRIVDIAFKKI